MSEATKIEWCAATWNPVTGCSKVSEGCRNCYAERMAKRLRGRCGYPSDDPFRVTQRIDRLEQPLRWKKPRRIFVCSMGDLFHDEVPVEFVVKMFMVMSMCLQHTFIILTKRANRMAEICALHPWFGKTVRSADGKGTHTCSYTVLPNLILGVSVESQEHVHRIKTLCKIRAAVRIVSVEPLLGAVQLRCPGCHCCWATENATLRDGSVCNGSVCMNGFDIDGVIVGGESGPGARPMHPDWVRSIRDQCQAAGVPLFFKQWGEWGPGSYQGQASVEGLQERLVPFNSQKPDLYRFGMIRLGKKSAGRLLDGRTWDEFPDRKAER